MRLKNKMVRYAINGSFLRYEITGIERYSIEIIKEIDKICVDLDIELVVPEDVTLGFDLKNIKVAFYGRIKGFLWSQTYFTLYLIRNNAVGLRLGRGISLLRPNGINCIHDIRDAVSPKYAKYTKRCGVSIIYWVISNFSRHIVTDSEFSKKEIIEKYKISPQKISVIYNAWQHFRHESFDESCVTTYSALIQRGYFFSIGSIFKHKNLEWVISVAKKNPNHHFVIAGKIEENLIKSDINSKDINNLQFLGYVSDNEVKVLMKYCKAFLFPSLYEGFGIPPLEALSLGATAIVSNATCLPEIYGKSVHYIDPYDYDVDLDKLLSEPVAPASEVLDKYSWEKSARQWYDLLKKFA